jgi:hypothetical protein
MAHLITHRQVTHTPALPFVCLLLLLALIVGPALSLAQTRYASAGSRGSDHAGLYVRIDPSYVNQAQDFTNALSKDFVDGAAIMIQWASLEPAPGVYEFAGLDQWVTASVTRHKKLSLGVMAGWFTPEWLYNEPYKVPRNSFNYNRNPQYDRQPHGMPACAVLTLPSPWNPVFIREYNKMIRDVARHLHELQVPGFPPGAAFDALRIVKLSGINNTTEELRLFAHKGDNGPCHQSDAQQIWAAVGFTPEKIISAWIALADNIAAAFPDQILSVDVIQVGAFPPIDSSGRVYSPTPGGTDALSDRIIDMGLSRFKGRFSVQWDALSRLPPNPAVLRAASQGAIMAWQMNQWAGLRGSGCIYEELGKELRTACKSPEEFDAILDNGVSRGAEFIEIWAQNVDSFAPSFQKAHDRLVVSKSLRKNAP